MFNQNLVPKETPATMMESSIFGGCYCSLPMNTDEEKKKIFNATNRADASLRECINMPIEMMGLYIEPVEFEAKDDDGRLIEGKTQLSPRMIIFDKDGKSYGCCSMGAYNSIKRIVSMYGLPDTWDKPITIVPGLVTSGKNQVLTITIV